MTGLIGVTNTKETDMKINYKGCSIQSTRGRWEFWAMQPVGDTLSGKIVKRRYEYSTVKGAQIGVDQCLSRYYPVKSDDGAWVC